MGFTVLFTPAVLALFTLAAVWLFQGLRERRRWKLFCSAGLFLLTTSCAALVMEFITRPL